MSKYGRVGLVDEYTCSKCNVLKPLDMFGRTKETKRGRGSVCKACKSSTYNVKSQMLANARKRAVRKGLDFNITLESIDKLIEQQNNRCIYSGMNLNWMRVSANKQRVCPPDRASLDRIDSSKGYTEDNIQLTTDFCNRIKTWYPSKDVMEFCELVVSLK